MYLHEAIYDLRELFQENLHMHTCKYSGCAKPDAILTDIIRAAEAAGLKRIAITDHIGAEGEKVQSRVEDYRPIVEASGTKIQVLLGMEGSAYDVDKYTMMNCDFEPDYRLYATNHYHVQPWVQPEDHSPAGYKAHNRAVMENVIRSGRCDCIAHPFVANYIFGKNPQWAAAGIGADALTQCWTDNEVGEVMELGKQYECAFELHPSIVLGDPVFARRYFNLGREIGVVFNMGTDAHTLVNIPTMRLLEDYRRILL